MIKALDMNKETLMNLPTAEEYKMKNIHILPTDKPSRSNNNQLHLDNISQPSNGNTINQNIYITSSEEIKEGDYVLSGTNTLCKCMYPKNVVDRDIQKIILTTDQDLIKDGVQLIDEEFLEWFVNHPTCESVEVESFCKYGDDCPSQGAYDKKHLCDIGYKIIIPKEECKKETLEEAVLNSNEHDNLKSEDGTYLSFHKQSELLLKGAEIGAKWQAERMYSDKDIMMVIERVIYLKNGWTPEGWSFYRDNNEIKEEVMNLLKNK